MLRSKYIIFRGNEIEPKSRFSRDGKAHVGSA